MSKLVKLNTELKEGYDIEVPFEINELYKGKLQCDTEQMIDIFELFKNHDEQTEDKKRDAILKLKKILSEILIFDGLTPKFNHQVVIAKALIENEFNNK